MLKFKSWRWGSMQGERWEAEDPIQPRTTFSLFLISRNTLKNGKTVTQVLWYHVDFLLKVAFCWQVPDGRRAGAVHTAAEPAARRHGHGAGDAAAQHGPGARRRRQVGRWTNTFGRLFWTGGGGGEVPRPSLPEGTLLPSVISSLVRAAQAAKPPLLLWAMQEIKS